MTRTFELLDLNSYKRRIRDDASPLALISMVHFQPYFNQPFRQHTVHSKLFYGLYHCNAAVKPRL